MDDSGAPDATLRILAKVSSLIEVLRLGGPYGLVHQLWSQFTLTASRVTIDVAWSRDEVLFGNYLFQVPHLHVHRPIGDVFWSIILNGKYSRILFRVFGWVTTHGQYSIEFEERGSEIWVMVRTWELSFFRRVCVAVLSGFSTNTTLEATILAKILDAAGPDTSVVKRCLQRFAASVFGSLDQFSMTEIVVNCLKGAETRDWMASRPALRKSIIANDFSMPGLVDVVANIVGVWPLVVSYLKETGRKDDGDSLVVRFFTTLGVLFASCKCTHQFFVVLEKRDGRVSVPRTTCPHENQAVPSSTRNL